MSTPAAVHALTYRGTDIQDLNGLFLEVVRGLDGVTDVRGVDSVVPARPGRISRSRQPDRLPIELVGYMRGVAQPSGADTDGKAYRVAVQLMQSLFDPAGGAGELIAQLEDGTYVVAQAAPTDVITEPRLPTFTILSIEMEAVDPPAWVVYEVPS